MLPCGIWRRAGGSRELGSSGACGLKEGTSTEHAWLAAFLRFCSRTMGWLYNFEGLYRFRNKMQPAFWEPIYIVAGSPISFFTHSRHFDGVRARLGATLWIARARTLVRQRLPVRSAEKIESESTTKPSRPPATKPRRMCSPLAWHWPASQPFSWRLWEWDSVGCQRAGHRTGNAGRLCWVHADP